MQPNAKSASDHIVADQSGVAAFLASPDTYGPDVDHVHQIDTHGAMVFLAGNRAYKVKRAVKFPYMDFSTLALRQAACEKEIVVNRRTAPDLYLGVVPIARQGDGSLALNGTGTPVEWALAMKRFAQKDMFDRMADSGNLTPDLMRAATDAIASFHDDARPVDDELGLGWVVEENIAELKERPDLFPAAAVADFEKRAIAAVERLQPILTARARDGRVRHCHGDLHLRNLVLFNGQPILFDAIEFNDAIAFIDVLYDLAFLLMDLDMRGLSDLANLCLNRYLQRRDELDGLAALPLFLSTRAAVRAKVSASAEASQQDAANREAMRREATRCFEVAMGYLEPAHPDLVAIGGLSGTGKTTLARTIAPARGRPPGAVHLRTDLLRKQLWGAGEFERLPQEAYTSEFTEKVYAELLSRTATALAAGQSVIADAVWLKPEERTAVQSVAERAGVPFRGLWLNAPEATITHRVTARTGDASDADAAVVRLQHDLPTGKIAWNEIDAGGSPADVAQAAHALLGRSR